jgi:hypothetical protein
VVVAIDGLVVNRTVVCCAMFSTRPRSRYTFRPLPMYTWLPRGSGVVRVFPFLVVMRPTRHHWRFMVPSVGPTRLGQKLGERNRNGLSSAHQGSTSECDRMCLDRRRRRAHRWRAPCLHELSGNHDRHWDHSSNQELGPSISGGTDCATGHHAQTAVQIS